MLNPGTFQWADFPIPYAPLPDQARDAALDSLKKRNFSALEDYKIFSQGENQPVTTNILAFTHPIHRTPEYAGLTVFNSTNGHNRESLIELLAPSTAPFHIIHQNDQFSFWSCRIFDGSLRPHLELDNISYDQLDNALEEYEADLQPKKITDVKKGYDTFTYFQDLKPLQLSLWAADITGKQLVKHFGATVRLLRLVLRRRNDMLESEKDILVTTLSIQLLGAIILSDTGVLGDDLRRERPPLDTLIKKAGEKFERYFKYDLFQRFFFEVEPAYEVLQKICYASFVPDMLKELYKTAYSREERKKSGSYDTSIHLTRRIWNNIPVEYLPPKNRVIADMTCGWGSFLVAGWERLAGLEDMEGFTLRNHIYGNDSAYFSAQLAGLGLLLSTSEDSWHIDDSDALSWEWLKTNEPTIIVGNPPFGGNRKKSSGDPSASAQRTREEVANGFLELAIERLAPGGYLAMLMPSSFVAAEASSKYRKKLLEYCDVTELWDIPAGVFDDATVRATVVFAQKKSDISHRVHHPVRVRTLQRHTLRDASHLGYTASGLVSDQFSWDEQKRKSKGSENTHIMDFKIILSEHTWDSIRAVCRDLGDYTTIIRGAIVGQKPENKRWSEYPDPREVPWLSGAKDVMPPSRPFFIDYVQSEKIIYPNALEEPRKDKNPARDKEPILAGVKVLVPYLTEPSWGKRIRTAIERRGHYISDHFYAIVPTSSAQDEHVSYEVITAILNWDVSNAWVVEHLKSPGIPKRIIESVPFPNDLNKEDCEVLKQSINQLEEAAYANQPLPKEVSERIDAVLKRAYHLDDATFTRLRKVSVWRDNPQITIDPLPDSEAANWSLSGVVERIDAQKGTITLNISDFDAPQEVRIVPAMPGWMLRPNSAFITKIPRKYIKNGIIDYAATDWGAFYPQHYTYMTEEELLAELATFLHSDKKQWA